MIKIKYDLVEDRYPTITTANAHVHCKINKKQDLQHHANGIPDRSLVAFHTQLGMMLGYFERLGRIYFAGNITIQVRYGQPSMDGDVTVHWKRDGVLVDEIMQEVDGLACALAHGYLGDYAITLTFSQTCEIKAAA